MLLLQAGASIHAGIQCQWYKALYWGGAFLLTVAIVKGMGR